MTEIKIVHLPTDEQDKKEEARFKRMMKDFEYFSKQSNSPFGPCGFLHKQLDEALNRAYAVAYEEIGKAKDPNPFICAAMHMKKCLELSKEMTGEISSAMGDMQRGGSDQFDGIKQIMELIRKAQENGR